MTNKYNQGDIIRNGYFTRKILGVAGEVYFLSFNGRYDEAYEGNFTERDLTNYGYKVVQPTQPKWVPEMGKKYWHINEIGTTSSCNWLGENLDIARLAFGNCFKDLATAEARLAEIKKVLNK